MNVVEKKVKDGEIEMMDCFGVEGLYHSHMSFCGAKLNCCLCFLFPSAFRLRDKIRGQHPRHRQGTASVAHGFLADQRHSPRCRKP